MLLQVDKPYTDLIEKIISLGFAENPNEVVRQSLVAYQRQIEFEELYIVDKAIQFEMNKIHSGEIKLINVNDVVQEAGL